jgi:hypothetical protein
MTGGADGESSMEGSPPEPDEDNPAAYGGDDEVSDGGATRTLLALLSRHPFYSLFRAVEGALRNGGKPRAVLLFACVSLDLLFTLLVVALILGITFALAWKTLAPLPNLHSPSSSTTTTGAIALLSSL